MALGLCPAQEAERFLSEELQNADWAENKARFDEEKAKNPYEGFTERMLKREKKKLEGKQCGKAVSKERVNQQQIELKRVEVEEEVAKAMRKRAESEGPDGEGA